MNIYDEINPRQRINLSYEAQSIINSDRFTFSDGTDEAIKLSGIINRIFLSLAENSAVRKQDQQRTEMLLAKKPPVLQTEIPTLNKKTRSYLERQDILETCKSLGIKPAKFVKAVIEEYAEMPFIERERIYFSDAAKVIENNLNRVLCFESGKFFYEAKPYSLMPDKQSTYNYLVCKILNRQQPNRSNLSSFRLSRISKIAPKPDAESCLSIFEVEEIVKAINEKGVPFLRGDLCDIEVELTQEGVRLFKSVLFMRPEVIRIEGRRYFFRCTATQAEIYFFKFGADAKILKPLQLTRKFNERFKRAHETYHRLCNVDSTQEVP